MQQKKPRKPRKDAERNRAKIRKWAHLPVDAIAKRTGLSDDTVYRTLALMGIKRVKRDRGPLSDKARVIAMVRKHGVQRAADRLKVSRQAVYLRLTAWDVS